MTPLSLIPDQARLSDELLRVRRRAQEQRLERHAAEASSVYHLVDDPARQVQVLHLMPAQAHGYAVLALPASTRGVVIDYGLDRDEAELVASEARATILRLRADPKEAIRRG